MGTLPFDLEIEDIAALADIINEKDLGEIRLEDDDIGAKIVIKGKKLPPPPPPMMQPAFGAAPAPAQAPVTPAKTEEKADAAPEGETVKAPVVGTYYSSPAPDKPVRIYVGGHSEPALKRTARVGDLAARTAVIQPSAVTRS